MGELRSKAVDPSLQFSVKTALGDDAEDADLRDEMDDQRVIGSLEV